MGPECFLKYVMAHCVAEVIYMVSFGFKKVSWMTGMKVFGVSMPLIAGFLVNYPSLPHMAFTLHLIAQSMMVWRALDR